MLYMLTELQILRECDCMKLREFYHVIGEDYDLLLSRLLSSERIETYLTVFFDDNNMEELKEQICHNQMQLAIVTAHTLKGVTATLGFEHLATDLCELHGLLKKNETEKAEVLCQHIAEAYEHIHQLWCAMHNNICET